MGLAHYSIYESQYEVERMHRGFSATLIFEEYENQHIREAFVKDSKSLRMNNRKKESRRASSPLHAHARGNGQL